VRSRTPESRALTSARVLRISVPDGALRGISRAPKRRATASTCGFAPRLPDVNPHLARGVAIVRGECDFLVLVVKPVVEAFFSTKPPPSQTETW
jgi:hypothetical protein